MVTWLQAWKSSFHNITQRHACASFSWNVGACKRERSLHLRRHWCTSFTARSIMHFHSKDLHLNLFPVNNFINKGIDLLAHATNGAADGTSVTHMTRLVPAAEHITCQSEINIRGGVGDVRHLLGWKMIMTDGWWLPSRSLYHLYVAWSLGNVSLLSSSTSPVSDSHLWVGRRWGRWAGGQEGVAQPLTRTASFGKALNSISKQCVCTCVVVCRPALWSGPGMCSVAFTCLPLLRSYFR